jgi:hypothetical protein
MAIMNWYMKSITAEKVQPKDNDFSWAFINVPENIMEVHSLVTRDIDKDDLYIEKGGEEGGDWSYGIEDDVHITAIYGLTFDDPDPVMDALKNDKMGRVDVKGIEIFEQDNYDVLVVKCSSKELNDIHTKLSNKFQIEERYPEYKPHMTIAYFQKGMAEKYIPLAKKYFLSDNMSFKFKEIFFEDRKDNRTTIKLK